MRYKMPELRLRAIELGSDLRDVSAACLHIAHWESRSVWKNKAKQTVSEKIRYLLFSKKCMAAKVRFLVLIGRILWVRYMLKVICYLLYVICYLLYVICS
jgi:hypothetical protein